MTTQSVSSFGYTLRKRFFHVLVKISNALFGENILRRSRIMRGMHTAIFGTFRYFDSARRAQAKFERENPEAPWLVPDSITRLEEILQPDFRYLEWGTGRSTLWFGERVGEVVSIEHHPEWYAQIKETIEQSPIADKVSYLFVEGDAQGPDNESIPYVAKINDYPNDHFDMILVDGMARNGCIKAALPKLKPSGYLVVDNAERLDTQATLDALPAKKKELFTNGIWETHIYSGFEDK